MTEDRLANLHALARRLHRYPAAKIEPYMPQLEKAIADLMDATFEEPDQSRKTRMAAVELKLRLMRERVIVKVRN